MPAKPTDRRTADVSRRISDQRTEALGQANDIRERRAALKRRLKDGDESLATLILDPPDYLHTARVEMLVMTTKTTIGRLTERQRIMLASKLPAQRR